MGILSRITFLFRDFNWLIIPAAFFAIVIHEVSHGYVAYLLGDKTAMNSGRLSLNPIHHMDPIGLICMVLFGFGWAKPVPINPIYFKHKKIGISLVSIAGPVSNFIMAAISLIMVALFSSFEVESGFLSFALEIADKFFILSAVLNVGLMVFNLIPISPLDGSKILFAILPKRAYAFVLKYEKYGMLILLVLINIPVFSSFLTAIRENVFYGMVNIISSLVY